MLYFRFVSHKDTKNTKVEINKISTNYFFYTEAGKAIGFVLEQSLHVVALPCSALRIAKRLQHIHEWTQISTKKICVKFVKIRGQNKFLETLKSHNQNSNGAIIAN
jgi:hypothetical protein